MTQHDHGPAIKTPKLADIKVLFENDSIAAINKPAGLVVHGDGKTVEPNVCDWVLATYGDSIKEVGEPTVLTSGPKAGETIYRPGIVHRLDRETSGVLLIAKTQAAYEHLKSQFQEHTIQKTYNTFVWGIVKGDKGTDGGTIDRPIGKSRNDFRKWSAQRFARGELRPAVTDFKILGTYKDFATGINAVMKEGISYIEVYPKTGRTHQIRVHFKAINHPVLGDRLYAPNHPYALGFDRLALHARKIAFTDIDGTLREIEAELPSDFVEALNICQK